MRRAECTSGSLSGQSQWPRRGPRASGPAALAVAVLLDALVVAGFIPRSQSRRPAGSPAVRATVRAYLAGDLEDVVPLPLAIACALAGVDQDGLARIVRRRSADDSERRDATSEHENEDRDERDAG
jgi:hypothetical protein